MNHFATPEFWFHDHRLPAETRELADRCFAMLQANPHHPSLRLKRVGNFWSARVGLRIRVLARDRPKDLVWFWIGPHDRYEELIARRPTSLIRSGSGCRRSTSGDHPDALSVPGHEPVPGAGDRLA